MPRAVHIAAALVFVVAGCAVADREIEDDSDVFGRPVAAGSGTVHDGPAPDCIVLHVTEGVIQLHRVVVTLDGGVSDGVRAGMKGVLATGRPFTIISADVGTSRAVITGLNLKIAPGTEACLYRDTH